MAFKDLAAILLLLISLQAAVLYARSGTEENVALYDAMKYEEENSGHRTAAAQTFNCGSCKYVSRRAFSSASQFVGERHVHEAVTHFCGELEYMDIIEDAELKGCVNRIMHKARDGGYYKYGIAYMRAGDICTYYGACKSRHSSPSL